MASLPPALPNSSTSRGLEINSFQGSSPKLTFLQQPGPCSLEKIAASPQEIEAKVRQDSPSPELLSSENFPESPPESEVRLRIDTHRLEPILNSLVLVGWRLRRDHSSCSEIPSRLCYAQDTICEFSYP